MFITVIKIRRFDGLTPFQSNFLSRMFNLKTTDEININRLLINLSFETRIRRSFGEKPHSLLIYYKSYIKLKPINTDFIKIINSIDDAKDYEELNKDNRYFTIGSSSIAKLDPRTAKKVNKLITSTPFITTGPTKTNNIISSKPRKLCNHYRNYNHPYKTRVFLQNLILLNHINHPSSYMFFTSIPKKR